MDLQILRILICSGATLIVLQICGLQITGVGGVRHTCYTCKNITNITACEELTRCHEGEVCYGEKSVQADEDVYNLGCRKYEQCPDSTTTTSTSVATTATTTPANTSEANATTTPMPQSGGNLTTTTPQSGSTVTTAKQQGNVTTTPPHTTKTSTTINSPTRANSTITSNTPTKPAATAAPSQTGAPLVGRSLAEWMLEDTSTPELHCCSTSECNLQLFPEPVDNATTPACEDKIGFDCETADNFFQICADTQKAKLVCKKYCKLCLLVDGNWSDWTDFTQCDVTCGNGTQYRTRNCTNPPPKNGGMECVGNDTDYQTCHPRACPVHGNWAGWSDWTGCSVSCGVGLQVRDRNCSDPFPDPDGMYCFGRAASEQICFVDYCEDGTWTDWGAWGECSRTCDAGLKVRHRNCSTGDSKYTRPCTGDPSETRLCNTQHCNESAPVAFSVSGSPHPGEGNSTIALSQVITNDGDHYNVSTGKFTAPMNGLYEFFITIEKQVNVGQAFCHLMKNDASSLLIIARSIDIGMNPGSYEQASNAAVLHLDAGDTVYLGQCTAPDTMSETCSFSGVQIV